MNNINVDTLIEKEREFYADNREDLASLLRMVIDAEEESAYREKMLDDAETEIDSLARKLSLVLEMAEVANDLEKLQKSFARIKTDLTMLGVLP